ncbi:MAG: caspase family protein, partial [Desulfobacterales bacterium]|nr:caspase family protein [Desulfobacterales bacterium]
MKIIIDNPMTPRAGLAVALLICLMFIGVVRVAGAEDRALLVGVGTYRIGVTLPGIDQDLEMMKEAVQLMGFKEGQVKTLKDSDATLDNIRDALAHWLVEGVGPGDRVLFYFSGHGSQVKDETGDKSDESDGADEVLCPYDVGREGKKLTRALLDDDFGKLLSGIPARCIFVFLDACHSGTATRDLPLAPGELAPKFFEYPDMPRTKSIFALEETAGNSRYIAVSACKDDEKALASNKGSLFTRGILSALREAVIQGKKITVAQLKDKAALYIKNSLKERGAAQHPVISGNPLLKNISLMKPDPGAGGAEADAGAV